MCRLIKFRHIIYKNNSNINRNKFSQTKLFLNRVYANHHWKPIFL